MIPRFKQQYTAKESQVQDFTKLGDALAFIRHITDKHIQQLQPLITIATNTETKAPSLQDLDLKLLDKAISQQYKKDVETLKGNDAWYAISVYSALGPFEQIFRICRDIRASQASREDRLLKALRSQTAKAKANTKDISSLQGVSIMKGAYI